MNKNDLMKKYFFVACFPEIEDGWLPLLDSMCEEIFKIIKMNESEYKDLEYPFEFTQIKEKYGRLTCYASFLGTGIDEIILKYEEKSLSVCEICGMKGEMRDMNGWYQMLCDNCHSKRLQEFRIKGVDV